ncbi:MAG: diguanylate cyclase [Gammaproteobacteria bacterium]|nr:diguanylate cyclase [Gammaproteobacteria bacterium]
MAVKVESHDSFAIDEFEILPWNDNFNTGHEIIDEQHRTLVNLFNKLGRTLIEQKPADVISATDELANYANVQFANEEAIWLKYFDDDSWLKAHQYNHAAFIPKIKDLKEKNAGRPLSVIAEDIMKFLLRWLAFHIIEEDKRMAIAIDAVKSGASIEEAKIIANNEMSTSLHYLIETILNMYDDLSSRAIVLLRERNAGIRAEAQLKEANRKLAELSNTDQLTGLYNRRYLDVVFDRESRRALRDHSMLTYYMIDVDHFKNYNDNYGHPAGDMILEQVAACLKKTSRRPHDYVFRVGGEEFGILTTFQSEADANTFAEIIRKSIEDLNIPHEYSEVNIHITISIGGHCCTPAIDCKFKDYMEIADRRLYIAKTHGRNRVVMSG